MAHVLSPALLLLTALLTAMSVSSVATAQQWELLDGAARDVGVGADGSVWVIGTNQVQGGYGIWRRGPSGWISIPGGAERIAVDPQGNAWVVNNTQGIFRYDGSRFVQVNGSARDIGVGADGTVWVIGIASEGGGYAIYRSKDRGANWTKIPGNAVRISVDPQGNAWVVNNAQAILRYDGSQFVLMPGAAKDVGVGTDGSVWVIGADAGIYRWEGSNWVKKTGGAAQIAGGPSGIAWVVNDAGQIWRTQVTPIASASAVPPGAVAAGPVMGSIVTSSGLPTGTPVGAGTQPAPSTTGGTLVTGTGIPGIGSSTQPLVVSGLAPPFQPRGEMPGTYLCPLIAPGPKLQKGCTDLFGPTSLQGKTSGPATKRGAARSDTCPSDFIDDGDFCRKPAAYGRGFGYGWGAPDKPFDSSGQWARCQKDNPQGCEQPGGGITLVYPKCKTGFHAVGTNFCSPDCPSGWDDWGVSCRKQNRRDNCGVYGRAAGLGYAFFDPREGGECWSCPVLMHRTIHPVTSTDSNFPACDAGNDDGIMWQSAQYPEPGVSAFILHADIVNVAFNDRAYVDAFLTKRAGGNATRKQQLWDQMINAPNDSPEFKALIFASIMTVAKRDPNLTSNAAQAVQYFQSYIRKRRTYIAQEALAMYNKYLEFNAYKQWQGAKSMALAGGPLGFVGGGSGAIITSPSASLGSTVGVPPDDYVNAAYAAAVPDSRGQAFITALTDLAGTPYTNTGTIASIDPTPGLQLGLTVASSAKAVYDLLTEMKVVQEISALGGRVGMGIDLGTSLAGSVLDAVATIMNVYAQQAAKDQYASLVTEADKPVSIARTLTSGSDDEKNELIMWWALATSGYKSSNTVGQTQLSNAEVCALDPARCALIKTMVTAARP